MVSSLLTAAFALSAAAAWGSGDFTNGVVTRRLGTFHTILISYIVGLVLLVVMALVRLEPLSSPADLTWGALSGLAGMVGLGFLSWIRHRAHGHRGARVGNIGNSHPGGLHRPDRGPAPRTAAGRLRAGPHQHLAAFPPGTIRRSAGRPGYGDTCRAGVWGLLHRSEPGERHGSLLAAGSRAAGLLRAAGGLWACDPQNAHSLPPPLMGC